MASVFQAAGIFFNFFILNFARGQTVTPTALGLDWTSVQTGTPLVNWNRGLEKRVKVDFNS